MNETEDLGWRLRLDDEISFALEYIGQRWQGVQESIDSGGARVVRAFANIEERVRGAGTAFASWAGRGLTTAARGIAAFAGQTGILSGLLNGPAGIAGLLHGVMRGAIEAGAEVENLSIAFTTLARGDANAARAHLEELQRFAVGKPFEFAFLATASRNLQTYGFAMRDVTGLLQDFGDAAFTAGTGSRGVDTMVRVFGQINTLGRMTRGHISQLVGAGVNAVPILREQLHLTDQQIQNIARSGIPAADIINALRRGMQSQFSGGLDRAAGTLSARLSDLADIVGNIRRQIYGSLGPGIIPVIAAGSGFLVDNASAIATVLSTSVLTVVRLIGAVLMPFFYAIRGELRRSEKDATASVGGIVRTLRNAALLIEGVSALIVGDDGSGLSSISAALRERLVKAGLWQTATQIARFASYARAFIGGAVGEVARRVNNAGAILQRVAGWFGFAGSSMLSTRERARQLGVQVVQLVAAAMLIARIAGIAVLVARNFQYVQMAVTGVRVAFTFLAAHPIVLALLAVGVALFLLYRHAQRSKDVMEALRGAWSGLAGAFAPIAAAFRAVLPTLKEAAESALASFADAGRSILDALRPAWPVLRLVASAIAVVGYLAAVAFGRALKGAAGVALAPVVMIARAVGALASAAFPYLQKAGARAFLFLQSFAAAAGPALARLWPVLRLIASVVAVVVVGAFVGLQSFAAWAIDNTIGRFWRARGAIARVFSGIVQGLRDLIAPLLPFVEPIFGAIGSAASRVFGGVLDRLFAMLRSAAGALVRAFEGLPPELQPAALRGAISNLRAFSSGKSLTANDRKDAAVAAAPASNDLDAGRRLINDRAPASARGVARLERAHRGLAMHLMAAPAAPVTVHVEAPPVILDGRRVDDGLQRRRTSETLRAGGTVPSR